MGPLKNVDVINVRKEDVRPIEFRDFEMALESIKASVSPDDLKVYEDWERKFGSS
jgi:SpoVK/Ycf46/Vps4 family AAA+-type ATPase